jgi:anti-sigma factor RsiW
MKTKIDCKQILSLLKSGYFDDEFEQETREEVDRHLAECPACRRTRENLEAITLLLRNAPRAKPPENIWTRIQKEIRPARARAIKPAGNFSASRLKYFFLQKKPFAFAAAAALVLIAAGLHVMTSRTASGEFTPSLSAFIDNDEMHEPNINFGSNIEKYLL